MEGMQVFQQPVYLGLREQICFQRFATADVNQPAEVHPIGDLFRESRYGKRIVHIDLRKRHGDRDFDASCAKICDPRQ